MVAPNLTEAEKRALAAEELPAFSGIKLRHIKNQLAQILGLIGRGGVFDEYTRHDISHVDKMLGILEWLVPDRTKEIISPADWLITVLAIYFHDVGMLVTTKEYESRNSCIGYIQFREEVLHNGDEAIDYKASLDRMKDEDRERFLYQEFVRRSHPTRAKAWVLGAQSDFLGVAHDAISVVDDLLNPLPQQFRRDLGMLCESHHLNDLDNIEKYMPSRAYGDSNQETVNLQYVAVLLRAADLLHMTSDRTPSTEFRLISLSDPKSQEEWARQKGVTTVRSKIGFNKEGIPDQAAHRDTIEVQAYFTDETGFFGLTTYLTYVRSEISRCHTWCEQTKRRTGMGHEFPWRFIDDSHVEAEGFLPNQFEFTLDQAKILDLLTGHTLYNDTSVVLRELVQNSLDAIRLQNLIEKRGHRDESSGKVEIHWNGEDRVLTVSDNGTGMSREIVENHLLKIGASRYQEKRFKEDFPEFSPISRFGIGILTTFMVADKVEIATFVEEEQKGISLALRSVHGKYLLRHLDKTSDSDMRSLLPHGTSVRLHIRPSAKIPDIAEALRKWVVVPGCEVTLIVDQQTPVTIGFSSPKEALRQVLNDLGISDEDSVKIKEVRKDCVTLAYALRWSDVFKEWSFLDFERVSRERSNAVSLGVCIEGVRIEFDTPGFNGKSIVAICNLKGPSAPRTNVVRSGLEETPERQTMLEVIYSIFSDHVSSEVEAIYNERDLPLTWAAEEAVFLINPLLGYRGRGHAQSQDDKLFYESLFSIPVLLVEQGSERRVLSVADVRAFKECWTTCCALFEHAERILREVRGPVSLSHLITALGHDIKELPRAPVVCWNTNSKRFYWSALKGKEVAQINVYKSQRRADLKWELVSESPRWVEIKSLFKRELMDDIFERRGYLGSGITRSITDIFVPRKNVKIDGLSGESVVVVRDEVYVVPNTQLSAYLMSWVGRLEEGSSREEQILRFAEFSILLSAAVHNATLSPDDVKQQLLETISDYGPDLVTRIDEYIDLPRFLRLIEQGELKSFNPFLWQRAKDN